MGAGRTARARGDGELIPIDLDATLVIAHLEKEQADLEAHVPVER